MTSKRKNVLYGCIGALTVLVIAGSLLAMHLRNKRQTPETADTTVIMTETTFQETELLQTSLSAAASVQTEVADEISEIVTVPETEAVIILTEHVTTEQPPETVTEAVTHPSETVNASTAPEAVTEPYTVSETAIPVTEPQTTTPEETEPAFSSETTATLPEETEPAMTETSVSETIPETTTSEEKITYRTVLESIFRHQNFEEDYFEYLKESDISENEFAIYDVDNDGQEELIIRWSNTAMVYVVGIVYGYDSDGNIYQKLKTTPYLRFFSNGVIEADDSHNQGLSGAFWPYSLYHYDSETGLYQKAGHVEAWDESIENEYSLETYPYEADISKSGFVYYIDSPAYDYGSETPFPVDVTEYDFWHESYLKDAVEIHLPFRKMTEENIAQVNQ